MRLAALPPAGSSNCLGDWLTVVLRKYGTMMPGPERAGFNLPALLCWAVGACAVFSATHRFFDKTTAFRALLLFSALPVYFWRGTDFSPDSVFLLQWALVLWLMALAFRRRRYFGFYLGALVVAGTSWNFWPWHGGGFWPVILRALDFVPFQLVLVTPMALVAAGGLFWEWRASRKRSPLNMAIGCALIAGLFAFAGWISGSLGITSSGALWLPLIPFIASSMQNPGKWWGPVIYVCVLCYGSYFYCLAFEPR